MVKAFFQLVRWPNLLFIVLTQFLFYYVVYGGIGDLPQNKNSLFILLVAASVLIAAAGYIINDYFDLHIDLLNKPEKVVIGRTISRRWAIALHMGMSAVGIALSFYVAWTTKVWLIGPANMLSVLLLWFYSTTFKRKTLIGNIIIALLTAWVIIVVFFFTGADFFPNTRVGFDEQLLFKFMVVYAGFAFIVTLIREAIKDLEDMRGDAALKCETMPITWGVPATKMYVGVWLVVAIASIAIILLYVMQSGWWLIILYALTAIIYPLIKIFLNLKPAETTSDYHQLSNLTKIVMLSGILSMLFFAFLK